MRRQIMSTDYQKLKQTNLYKELESIYPSDISVIIAGYNLEKTEKFHYKKFEDEHFEFSIIGTRVIISNCESTHIHEIDDFDNSKTYVVCCDDEHMFRNSHWTSIGEYLYATNHDQHKMSMLDKSMRIISEYNTKYVCCMVAHNNNLYVASYEKIEILDKNLVLLNTIRGFESLEKICVYDDKIYVVDDHELKICDGGNISDVIMKNVDSIAIFDGMIYVCNVDVSGFDCYKIYDMKFNYIRNLNYDFDFDGVVNDIEVSNDHVLVSTNDCDDNYFLHVLDREYSTLC